MRRTQAMEVKLQIQRKNVRLHRSSRGQRNRQNPQNSRQNQRRRHQSRQKQRSSQQNLHRMQQSRIISPDRSRAVVVRTIKEAVRIIARARTIKEAVRIIVSPTTRIVLRVDDHRMTEMNMVK